MPVLGVTGDGTAHVIDNESSIRAALRDKASAYGRLDTPYVIAVLSNAFPLRDEDFMFPLFGTRGLLRSPDGLWHEAAGPARQHVSAVIAGMGIHPWDVAQRQPVVWLNPWAARPISDEFGWGTRRLDLASGQMERRDAPGLPLNLFGLAADWPGPEDLELW
jgi:hypothetical protein